MAALNCRSPYHLVDRREHSPTFPIVVGQVKYLTPRTIGAGHLPVFRDLSLDKMKAPLRVPNRTITSPFWAENPGSWLASSNGGTESYPFRQIFDAAALTTVRF